MVCGLYGCCSWIQIPSLLTSYYHRSNLCTEYFHRRLAALGTLACRQTLSSWAKSDLISTRSIKKPLRCITEGPNSPQFCPQTYSLAPTPATLQPRLPDRHPTTLGILVSPPYRCLLWRPMPDLILTGTSCQRLRLAEYLGSSPSFTPGLLPTILYYSIPIALSLGSVYLDEAIFSIQLRVLFFRSIPGSRGWSIFVRWLACCWSS